MFVAYQEQLQTHPREEVLTSNLSFFRGFFVWERVGRLQSQDTPVFSIELASFAFIPFTIRMSKAVTHSDVIIVANRSNTSGV